MGSRRGALNSGHSAVRLGTTNRGIAWIELGRGHRVRLSEVQHSAGQRAEIQPVRRQAAPGRLNGRLSPQVAVTWGLHALHVSEQQAAAQRAERLSVVGQQGVDLVPREDLFVHRP